MDHRLRGFLVMGVVVLTDCSPAGRQRFRWSAP